jgi:hypothetical protein
LKIAVSSAGVKVVDRVNSQDWKSEPGTLEKPTAQVDPRHTGAPVLSESDYINEDDEEEEDDIGEDDDSSEDQAHADDNTSGTMAALSITAIFLCGIYMIIGPALIFLNKHILADLNFPYPMFLR